VALAAIPGRLPFHVIVDDFHRTFSIDGPGGPNGVRLHYEMQQAARREKKKLRDFDLRAGSHEVRDDLHPPEEMAAIHALVIFEDGQHGHSLSVGHLRRWSGQLRFWARWMVGLSLRDKGATADDTRR
jgi:hypothetical protein